MGGSDRTPHYWGAGGLVAVATDVGAWRVLAPVIAEFHRRGQAVRLMLAEPAASFAACNGLNVELLDHPALGPRAEGVIATKPQALLLGTSPANVVEQTLARRAGGRMPTLGVLDAMLFVERRFGPGLRDLPDLVACPDRETAERLVQAGARPDQVPVTGNPTLEAIAAARENPADPPSPAHGPTDVLFVSQPVLGLERPDSPFSIDEHRSLTDLIAALASLADLSPLGYRVRVRWHPTQPADRLPSTPPNIQLATDDLVDRLASVAQARLVVGISSTLLTEARMLARPAIAYLPGAYWQHEQVYTPHQGVSVARSAADLRSLISNALSRPPEPAPSAWHAGAAAKVADLLLHAMANVAPTF